MRSGQRISMPNAATLRSARVLVVGDVMLDRNLFGEVSRISLWHRLLGRPVSE